MHLDGTRFDLSVHYLSCESHDEVGLDKPQGFLTVITGVSLRLQELQTCQRARM